MSNVFVLDTNKQPLAPTHPARARQLLASGKAAVFKRYPFTIILKRGVGKPVMQPLRIKLDPGSRVTGLAIVNDVSGEVVFAAELTHRGQVITKRLERRRSARRSRRQRNTRYRKPRFHNRKQRQAGWLPPSLESRVCNVVTWTKRLVRLCPITAISQELVKFDMQLLENAEIAGVEYQQGSLQGYELREYLLEKWGRRCVYCGATDIPLQVEHIIARAKARDDRVCNLTIACERCNQAKGTRDIRDFLAHQHELLATLLARAKAPLKDAAAVNTTRWALYERLKRLGLPVECGSGGLTKHNRTQQGLPKQHWVDASCVGESTPWRLHLQEVVPLLITANGYGSRQMCLMDKRGFQRTRPKQARRVQGYQTGDIVKAVVTSGRKRGVYVGRVAVRSTGFFNITSLTGTMQGINHRFCRPLHRVDGYSYQHGRRAACL